jgi:hypothetical protein
MLYVPNRSKIFEMTIKCNNIFQFKATQNLLEVGIFGLKIGIQSGNPVQPRLRRLQHYKVNPNFCCDMSHRRFM